MAVQNWNQFYNELESLVSKAGPGVFDCFDNLTGPLRRWCKDQQKAFIKNELSSSQLKRLLSVDFPLPLDVSEWDKRKENWTSKEKILFAAWLWQFENLRKYLHLNPHGFPKGTLRFPKSNNLGRWINLQSERFEAGKLEPDRVQLLKSISFPFRKIVPRKDAWNKQYTLLKQYRSIHPKKWPSHTEEFPKGNRLGRWLRLQRQMWIQGELPDSRVQLFSAIGVPQEIRQPLWMLRYMQLEEFVGKHSGRFPMLDEEYPRGNKIGRWAQRQRQFFRIGWLADEKRKLLDRLGFSWTVQPDNWKNQIRALKSFLQKFKRFPRTKEVYPAGNAIGRWVSHQRELRQSGELSQARQRELEKIGFIWDPRSMEWMERFRELRTFIEINGRMPRRDEGDLKKASIGSWARSQKDRRTKGLLPKEQIELLDRIGFVWDSNLEEWMQFYREVESALNRNGHLPGYGREEQDPKLARWLANQQFKIRQGNLDLVKARLLKKLLSGQQ